MLALPLPMTVVAVLLSLGGLAVLYIAWRRRGQSAVLRTLGWSLFALSVVPWAVAGGSGRGVALGLSLVGMAALLLIAVTGQWRGAVPRRQREAAAAEPVGGAGWGHWATLFVIAGPLSAIAAFALALPIMQVENWAEADRLIATAFAMVILWSAAAVWACATPRLMRAAATLAGLAAAGTALVLVF